MQSILYDISFTLAFCLCLFFGINQDSAYYQQILLVVSGFCFGVIALCVIEKLDE